MRSRKPRVLLVVLALAALTLSIITLVARARPLSDVLSLFLAVGSPFIHLVALTGLALSMLASQKLLSVVAVAVVAITVAVPAQWYYVGRPVDVGGHAEVRVLSSNLRKGQADASTFVALAEATADVITVSELTPEAIQRFSQAGINEVFPYSVLNPAPGAGGIGLWSRMPLTSVSPVKPQHYGMAAVRLQIPGVRYDPTVASVHVMSPVASETDTVADWRMGIASLKVTLTALAVGAGPGATIVAGDFNSTPDMRQFRDLMTNGYRDAVEQTGAGFAPTFPSDSWHPPLLTIDHILTRNAAAASIRTVSIKGSDHRALLATIKVPLDPTAS